MDYVEHLISAYEIEISIILMENQLFLNSHPFQNEAINVVRDIYGKIFIFLHAFGETPLFSDNCSK